MPLIDSLSAFPFEAQRNDLAHLQWEIARRADELAKSIAPGRDADLFIWLHAEREGFGRRDTPMRRDGKFCGPTQFPLNE
jgi:hypothetical protein